MKEKKIKRRGFLKLSDLVAGGLAVFGGFKLLKDDIFNQKSSPSKALSQSVAMGEINVQLQKTNVFVHASKQDHDMEAAVIKAAQAATDFGWLKTGQVVFIKIVNNSGFSYPSTTSPIAVSAMIKLLKQKGAGRVIVGDMSGIEHLRFFKNKTIGSTRELMKASGMLQAIEAAGGEPFFFEESGCRLLENRYQASIPLSCQISSRKDC